MLGGLYTDIITYARAVLIKSIEKNFDKSNFTGNSKPPLDGCGNNINHHDQQRNL